MYVIQRIIHNTTQYYSPTLYVPATWPLDKVTQFQVPPSCMIEKSAQWTCVDSFSRCLTTKSVRPPRRWPPTLPMEPMPQCDPVSPSCAAPVARLHEHGPILCRQRPRAPLLPDRASCQGRPSCHPDPHPSDPGRWEVGVVPLGEGGGAEG